MATKSGFFNSINRDRVYDANFFAEYFASFIGNGVFPNPSTGLQVLEKQNMTLTIKPGKAWINGYYFANDSDFVISLANADGTLNRIDRIVLRLNYTNREVVFAVKKGAFASSPVAPTLQRDADAYELGLADIYVTKGATSIVQAKITDLRLNSQYCGIVAGLVQQIDVSSVFNQYQDWFNTYSITKSQEFLDWQNQTKDSVDAWINSEQLDFDGWRTGQENTFANWFNQQDLNFAAWFNEMKNQLSTDAAGSLQLQMDNHINDPLPHRFTIDGITYKSGWKLNATKDGLTFEYEEV